MSDEIVKFRGSSGFSEILDGYPSLTPFQQRLITVLAQGMSRAEAARYFGVTVRAIAESLENQMFVDALEKCKQQSSNWQQDALNRLGIFAFDALESVLSKDVDEMTPQERTEALRSARFIIDKLVAREASTQVNINTAPIGNVLNISQGSEDAIARRLLEIQNGKPTDVRQQYDLDKVDIAFACHPECDYGVINYDAESEQYQCHICGGWFTSLATHSLDVHGLSTGQYRQMFSIEKDIKIE